MRGSQFIVIAGALSLLAASGASAAEPTHLGLDVETQIAGVDVASTGIGQTKLDPRWLAYPERVEFSDAKTSVS